MNDGCGRGVRGRVRLRGVARGSVGHETERALFLLRVVQPEHGVQPVEQPAELDRVLGLDGVAVQCLQQPLSRETWCSISAWVRLIAAVASVPPRARSTRGPSSSSSARSCGSNSPSSRPSRARTGSRSQWCEDSSSATERICSISGSVASCSARNRTAVAMSSAGMAMVWTAPGRTARSAMPIASTSMTSCTTAPAAGGSSPTAAATMATSDRPMPTRTACSAILFERRAIRIASPRASIRSTVSTTSAASEDAVAPRAASATPTPAAASAGASLTPSPTMIVAPFADSRSIAASLSAGSQSASTVSTPTMRPIMSAMSARSPVTSTTRVIPAVRSARTILGASGRIASCSRNAPAGLVVDGGEHRQRAVQVGAPAHLTDPGRGGVTDDPGCLAEPDPVAADGSLQAVAVHLLDVLGHLQGQPAPGAAGDDRAGQHVRRHLVQGRGESQHLVGVETSAGGDHVGQHRVSLVSGCRSCRTASPARRPGPPARHHP